MKLRLRNFMRELGFKAVDEVIYGIHDGYLVSISDSDGILSLFVDIVIDDAYGEQGQTIRGIINPNSRIYSIARAEITSTGVHIVFASTLSAFSKLRDFFYFFLQQLKTTGIRGASICTNCGNPISSLKIVSIHGRLHTCDPDCATKLAASNTSGRKKTRPLFIPGFIGAVIGAAVGVVPLLVLSRIDFFILWCGVFVGIFAKGGYELFGGRKCIAKSITLPLLSIIAIIPTLFYIYCRNLNDIWLQRNYIIPFEDVVTEIKSLILTPGPIRQSLILDSAITFGFAIFGLLLFIRFNKKSVRQDIFVLH